MARLYYESGLTQNEIAERLYISRTRVSRLLDEARETGIVEIKINYLGERCIDLEQIIQRELGVPDVRIFDNAPFHASEIEDQICLNSARCIDEYLKPGMIVGLTRGRISEKTLYYLGETAHKTSNYGLKCVQLFGSESGAYQQNTSDNLVRRIASLYGGEPILLHAPAVVSTEAVCNTLKAEPIISDTLALARRCDLVYTGIGALSHNAPFSSFWKGNNVEAELHRAIDQGGVGHIVGRIFNVDGEIIDNSLNRRIIGIDIDAFRSIEQVIGMCYGAERCDSLLGACRGGFISTLITDRACAEAAIKKL